MQQAKEQEVIETTGGIEKAVQSLWEKARESSLLIATLRDEKERFKVKIQELEEELRETTNQLLLRSTELDRLRAELQQLQDSAQPISTIKQGLTEDEKTLLQQKLRSVLNKIDSLLV